jgi:hypothetical protein
MEKKASKKKPQLSPYQSSKRSWIKLWVDEWLSGTTRFELDPGERSVFADLIVMAGKSRFPGIIAAGENNDGYIGYPIQYLAGTLVVPDNMLESALEKCAASEKIAVTRNGNGNVVIEVINFTRYQSEYQRQRPYRVKPESDPAEFERRYGHLGPSGPLVDKMQGEGEAEGVAGEES